MVLKELEMECQEKINEDMAYALSYLDIYGKQLNVTKLRHEMNNLMVIYGLSDMVYRGITLVKYYVPDGVMLSEIIHSCFCSHYNKTDVEVQQELGIGRTSFYKMKKQALRYLDIPVSSDEKDLLNKARKIRNELIHGLNMSSISTLQIKKLCGVTSRILMYKLMNELEKE